MKKSSRTKRSGAKAETATGPDWVISELEWRARSSALLGAQETFDPFPPIADIVVMEWRAAYLISLGFELIVDPANVRPESITMEKIHSNVLQEQHTLNIYGRHRRSLKIIDGARLDLLTKEFKAATTQALSENNPETVNELYGLWQKHWDLVRALHVRDPFASPTSAFSLEPLRGTTGPVRRAYLDFLTKVTHADELIGHHKGRNWELTGPEKKIAERLIRKGHSDLKVADAIWPGAEVIDNREAQIKRFRRSLGLRRRY